MYAIKLELKLNNKERSMLAGCAGFKRVVYNFGLDLLKNSWQFEGIKASDSKRLAEEQKNSDYGCDVPTRVQLDERVSINCISISITGFEECF